MLVYKDGEITHSAPRAPREDEIVWLNLAEPNPEEVGELLERTFKCHPLAVEDVLHNGQQPKLDEYAGDHPHAFISFYAYTKDFEVEEFSVLISKNFVVTVSPHRAPWLEHLEHLVEASPDYLETTGWLLYHVLDRCVDDWSALVGRIDEILNGLETTILDRPQAHLAQEIFRLRRRLQMLDRKISAGRDVLKRLTHGPFTYAQPQYDMYFSDVYDHAARIVSTLESARDSLRSLLDLQTSIRSARMNEIMKTLTVFSTIFLPLTFITGIYGMNFHNIPELSWPFGYGYVWVLFLAVTAGMVLYFRRRGWW